MKHIRILTVLALILWTGFLHAQQEPMYGQYLFNNTVINPAQAGANGINLWGALARNQWVGIDGAPRTETAFVNLRLPNNLGLAVGIYQDRLGPETNLQFQTDLAYQAQLSSDWYLAGGIRLIANHIRLDLTSIPNVEPGDPYFNENISSGILINAGAGLLAYSEQSFFGISIPKAFKNQIQIGDDQALDFSTRVARHVFAYGGVNLQLSREMMLTPSFLVKYSDHAPVQLDLNAMFNYGEVLDFGPLLRSNVIEINNWFDAIGFAVGIRFLDNWHLGYMYEYPMTDLVLATRQTHEISLRFFWDTKLQRRIRSPRYFL